MDLNNPSYKNLMRFFKVFIDSKEGLLSKNYGLDFGRLF